MAQFKKFTGYSTYSIPLERDLRELERYLHELEGRLGVLTLNEGIEVTTRAQSKLAKHAHTHATGGGATNTDPITPYTFTWKNAHTFTPGTDITPVTINASGTDHTANLLTAVDKNSNTFAELSAGGLASFGDATLSARVNIKSGEATVVAPDALDNLEMWLRADDINQGNNTTVVGWNDRSSGQNDYASFISAKPNYLTNVRNGHNAVEADSDGVRMDWSDPVLGTPGAGPTVTGEFTIFTVYRGPTSTNNCGMWGRKFGAPNGEHYGVTFPGKRADGSCDVYFGAGAVEPSPTFDNSGEDYCIGIIRRDSSDNLYYYHADPTTGLVDRTQAASDGGQLYIASLFQVDSNNTYVPAGTGSQLLEVVVFTADLSSANRNAIYNYLADLYDFPLTGDAGDILQWELSDGSAYGIIDENGHVGIGTVDLSSVNTNADELVIAGDANTGITILVNNTTGSGSIKFGDTGIVDIGQIAYNHTTNRFNILTGSVRNVQIGTTAEGMAIDFSSATDATVVSGVDLDIKGASTTSIGLAIHSSVLGGTSDEARFYIGSSTTNYATRITNGGLIKGGVGATGKLPLILTGDVAVGVHYTNVDAGIVSALEDTGIASNIHEFHLVTAGSYTLKSYIEDDGTYHESTTSGRATHESTANTFTDINTFRGFGIDLEDESGSPGNPPANYYRMYWNNGAGFVQRNSSGTERVFINQIQDDGVQVAATRPTLNFQNYFTLSDAGNAAVVDIDVSALEATIDHTSLLNIGTNSHAQIDTHIASTSDPHSVTWEQTLQNNAQADTAPIIDNSSAAAFTVRVDGDGGDVFTVRTDSSSTYGNVAINKAPGTPAGSLALDIAATAGTRAGINIAGPTTDNAIKNARVTMGHYHNEQLPITIFLANCQNTAAEVVYGGGSAALNGVTKIKFNTASNNTSGAGSTRMIIMPNGKIGMGEGVAVINPTAQLEVETSATHGSEAVRIDQNDVDKAFIDFEGTASPPASVAENLTTWTGGNTIQGFMRNEVNGSVVWMPWYDAPTNTVTQQTYTETNVSTDRAFDADTVAIAELADIVGTLIVDLRAAGIVL